MKTIKSGEESWKALMCGFKEGTDVEDMESTDVEGGGVHVEGVRGEMLYVC